MVLDVDGCHVPPHLALINGALSEVTVDRDRQGIVQRLVRPSRLPRCATPLR